MGASAIKRFTAEYRFLSNFYSCKVKYEGIMYPSAEHAYQAAKCLHPKDRRLIAKLRTAGEAKRKGHQVTMTKDFENHKLTVMRNVVLAKFMQNQELGEALISTYPAGLEEGNAWGDKIWGTVDGVGKNLLGKILMDVRRILREGTKHGVH